MTNDRLQMTNRSADRSMAQAARPVDKRAKKKAG
jgi:hypothetical protein